VQWRVSFLGPRWCTLAFKPTFAATSRLYERAADGNAANTSALKDHTSIVSIHVLCRGEKDQSEKGRCAPMGAFAENSRLILELKTYI
jgi:hypothetical protein